MSLDCLPAVGRCLTIRVGTALLYLFGDHLGSTSITVDASGGVSGEPPVFAGRRLPRSLRFARNDRRWALRVGTALLKLSR